MFILGRNLSINNRFYYQWLNIVLGFHGKAEFDVIIAKRELFFHSFDAFVSVWQDLNIIIHSLVFEFDQLFVV